MDSVTGENLVKYYKNFKALDSVSFTIQEGECFGFLGANGAGKTTLMNMIYGFISPTSGRIQIFDKELNKKTLPEIKRIIGVVPQDNNLDPDLSVIENLLVYARYFDIKRKEALKRAEELLNFVDLYKWKQTNIRKLSGGMKRKLTAGMENFKEMIIKILDTIFSPEIIILRNDSHSRLKEGLKLEKTIVKGDLNEFPLIIEDDIKFLFDPLHGQKTGFFLDQRENRIFLKNLITKGEGLDLFCYVGSWSLHMAKKGIKITGIDSSQNAIDLAKENAKINNLIDKSQFIKADVFDYLKWEIKKDKKYDLIVVDPPAFVKSKNEKKDALEGYLNLNTLAIKLLKKRRNYCHFLMFSTCI